MNYFTEEQANRITNLVREIERLTDVEKLFLYLQLPCGKVDGLEQGKAAKLNGISNANNNSNGNGKLNGGLHQQDNNFFSKKPDQETTQTYTWILSHLEVDPNVSLPKQEVYDEYRLFCQANNFEPLCVADFGKAMKHAFPCIKPRRLGQRGNSRYCYSGLRKKYKIQAPELPDLIEPTFCLDNDCSISYNQIMKDCRDNPDECPIVTNQQQHRNQAENSNCLNHEGVINLKIDPSSSSSSTGASHLNQNNYPEMNHLDLNTQNNSTSNSSSNSVSSEHLQQHQQQTFMQPRYTYNGLIQQPGSPDDDDYRHNYQDYEPILPTIADNGNQLESQHQQQQVVYGQASSTAGPFGAAQSASLASTSSFTYLSAKLNDTVAAEADSGEPSYLMGAQASGDHGQHNQFTQQGVGVHAHLVYMGNSHHFDSCASPFLSPASTPYPSTIISNNHNELRENLNYYQQLNGNPVAQHLETAPHDFIRYPN